MVNEINRYFGFGEETLYGETPNGTPKFHLDALSIGLKPPTNPNIIFEGSIGRTNRVQRPGFYTPSGPIEVGVDLQSFGWLAKFALGGYEFTDPETGKNIHEIWASNSRLLPSFAAYCGEDLFEHRFQGCVINNLTMNCGNEFATANIDINAQKDSGDAAWFLDPTDLELPTLPPFAAHELTHKINGTIMNEIVSNASLGFNNNLSTDTTKGHGSRYVKRIPANGRDPSISLTTSFETLDQLKRYWGANTGPSDNGATEFSYDAILTMGTSGSITFHYPRCILQDPGTGTSGKQDMTPQLQIEPLAANVLLADGTTPVNTECLITIRNDEPEMVLA